LTPSARKIRLVLELRGGGVTDTRALGAMERIPRELFVPAPFRDKAYDDVALPIGHHQTLSAPLVVGCMTQALEVGERHKVLEIGTGSGYQTAVLASLCRRVYTVERITELLIEAQARLAELRITNVTALCGDGALGWPRQAPFDRIMVTAAAAEVPKVLVDQLAADGVMVLPVEDEGGQRLVRVRHTESGAETEDLASVKFVPLV
jgi:protein-L-isoaspartate(D-aspartate) O-methyltransferase